MSLDTAPFRIRFADDDEEEEPGDTPVLTTLTVTPNPQTVNDGHTHTFAVAGLDQFGDAISAAGGEWSVIAGTGSGTIDSDGIFFALTAGTVTVRYTHGAVQGNASVTVAAFTPSASGSATLTVTPDFFLIEVGETHQIEPVVRDGGNTIMPAKPVTYLTEIGDLIAPVGSTGLVDALDAGRSKYLITAADNVAVWNRVYGVAYEPTGDQVHLVIMSNSFFAFGSGGDFPELLMTELAAYSPRTYLNLSLGGRDTGQIVASYPTYEGLGFLPPIAADNYAILSEGTNYYGAYAHTKEQTLAKTLEGAALIKADGWPVIVTTILPRTLQDDPWDVGRRWINQGLRDARRAGLIDYLADWALDPDMGYKGQHANTTYYSDGLHPDTPGKTKLAKITAEGVKTLRGSPTAIASVLCAPEDADPANWNDGQTVQFAARVYSASGVILDRPVTWSSNNHSAATVTAGGLVTLVANGSATITADAGGGHSDTYVITVT